jgi:hypothetical protein
MLLQRCFLRGENKTGTLLCARQCTYLTRVPGSRLRLCLVPDTTLQNQDPVMQPTCVWLPGQHIRRGPAHAKPPSGPGDHQVEEEKNVEIMRNKRA